MPYVGSHRSGFFRELSVIHDGSLAGSLLLVGEIPHPRVEEQVVAVRRPTLKFQRVDALEATEGCCRRDQGLVIDIESGAVLLN